MKKKRHRQSEVILPTGTTHLPQAHEQSAAHLLAEHFNCKVEFNAECKGYKIKTADITMNGVEWEIKSPTGSSKKTVSKQFNRAKKQSANVILDIRRTKLSEKYVRHMIEVHFCHAKNLKRIILINKSGIIHTIK